MSDRGDTVRNLELWKKNSANKPKLLKVVREFRSYIMANKRSSRATVHNLLASTVDLSA